MSGKTFQFRYRAYNIFGWSEYSDPQTAIIASTLPSKPLNIVTVNEETLTTVKITWDAPTDFGGDNILIEAYLISIYDRAQTLLHPAPGCDGKNPTVISTRTCSVEMAFLTKSPF